MPLPHHSSHMVEMTVELPPVRPNLAEWDQNPPTSWRDEAACIGVPVDVFFPDKRTGSRAEDRAFAICESCPVRDDCLAAALDEERGLALCDRHGIRGGLRPRDRWRLERYEHIRHGTAHAYHKLGCRCQPCKEAYVADELVRQRQRRAEIKHRLLTEIAPVEPYGQAPDGAPTGGFSPFGLPVGTIAS